MFMRIKIILGAATGDAAGCKEATGNSLQKSSWVCMTLIQANNRIRDKGCEYLSKI